MLDARKKIAHASLTSIQHLTSNILSNISMNNSIYRNLLQILPLLITIVLIQPVTAWAQATAEPELRIEKRHGGSVHSVIFSPDGKMLASAHNDSTIQLWDLSTGRIVRSFMGHTGHVPVVVFSPDGKMLAGGSPDQTVKFWEVSSGRFIRAFKGHNGSIYSVAFSPDGKMLASGSDDQTVNLWEVVSGRLVRTVEGQNSYVQSVAFSPDGKLIASGSYDQTLKLWEVNSGRSIRSFEGHNDWVQAIAFSPDGKMLASGSTDKTVKLWEVGTGNIINSIGNHDSSLYGSVAFSPDGTLALASYSSTIEFWDASAGHRIRSLKDHQESVTSVAFSPDGKLLASGSADGSIKIWGTSAGNLLASLMHFKDGNWIAFIPGNYFISSEGIARYISWRAGYNFYEADESPGTEYMSRFNQPDKVAAGLRGKEVANSVSSATTGVDNTNIPGKNPVITGAAKPPIRDTTAPKIVITLPSVTRGVGVKSTAGKISVFGQAFDDSGVKQVIVRGTKANLDSRGNFSAEVLLEAGNNLITVTATDIHG